MALAMELLMAKGVRTVMDWRAAQRDETRADWRNILGNDAIVKVVRNAVDRRDTQLFEMQTAQWCQVNDES